MAAHLALGAVIGPIVLDISWLILGIVSPGYQRNGTTETYSPISHPVSGLGLGKTAPFMNTAFVVAGVLIFVGVISVFRTVDPTHRPGARRASATLVALIGIGTAMCGVFDLEHQAMHRVGVVLALVVPVISFAVAGSYFRGLPGWRGVGTYLLVGSPSVLLVAIALLFRIDRVAADSEGAMGLVQRALILLVQSGLVVMGWHAYRQRNSV